LAEFKVSFHLIYLIGCEIDIPVVKDYISARKIHWYCSAFSTVGSLVRIVVKEVLGM